jgi:hypothetical protein
MIATTCKQQGVKAIMEERCVDGRAVTTFCTGIGPSTNAVVGEAGVADWPTVVINVDIEDVTGAVVTD